jgi:hypothetical protein
LQKGSIVSELQIFLPPTANLEEAVDRWLVAITETIAEIAPSRVGHGILGGEFGYGANFENDIFVMRTYYWGDCDCGGGQRIEEWETSNLHKDTCYQVELNSMRKESGLQYYYNGKYIDSTVGYKTARKIEDKIYKKLIKKYGLSEFGCAVHCTCGRWEDRAAYIEKNGHTNECSLNLPNFKHKASGFEVRWYKWIGRGMDYDKETKRDYNKIFLDCMDSIKLSSPQPAVSQPESNLPKG